MRFVALERTQAFAMRWDSGAHGIANNLHAIETWERSKYYERTFRFLKGSAIYVF